MATLLDTLQAKRNQLTSPQGGLSSETSRVQQLIQGRRGRLTSPGDVASSNIGEQVAVQQGMQDTAELARDIGQQAQAQQLQAVGQEQQTQIAREGLNQQRNFNSLRNKMQVNQLLSDLTREKDQLSTEQNQARLEQAGFLLSLQDKKYITELQNIGAQRRLNDEIAVRNELLDLTFGNSLDTLNSKLAQGDILSTSARKFKQMLGDLSVDDAIQIAEQDRAHRNTLYTDILNATKQGISQQAAATAAAAKWGGISGLASAGISGYDKYRAQQERKQLNELLAERANGNQSATTK